MTGRSYEFFAKMALEWSWEATWHQIISDSEQLDDADFIPNRVEVRQLTPDILPTMQVWQGLESELLAERSKTTASRSSGKRGPRQAATAPKRARPTTPVGSGAGRLLDASNAADEGDDDQDDAASLSGRSGASHEKCGRSWQNSLNASPAQPRRLTACHQGKIAQHRLLLQTSLGQSPHHLRALRLYQQLPGSKRLQRKHFRFMMAQSTVAS